MNNDLISRSALREEIQQYVLPIITNNLMGAADSYFRIIHLLDDAPAIDAEPVRYGRCALCRIKETGHGIIAFYKAGWQACITKRDGGYFMVIGHEGDQVHIPVDFCYNCGAKLRGDNDAAD